MALFSVFLASTLQPRAGVWAALIAVTSYDVFANSQLVLPDMLVVCFATMAAGLLAGTSHPSARGALPCSTWPSRSVCTQRDRSDSFHS